MFGDNEHDDEKDIMPDRKPFKPQTAKFRGCGTVRMPSLTVPSFKAAKQWFKQKVGAADRTKEEEDFVALLQHLDRLDAYLRKIFVQAKKTVDRWQSALDASEKLLELCKDGSNGNNDDSGSFNGAAIGVERLPKFLDAMETLVDHDELVNTNIIKFNKLHSELLRDQIERVLAVEAADALKAKTAYFHAVLEFDACRANLSTAEKQAHRADGPPNIAHAKEYLRMAKLDYENKKKSVANAIKHLDKTVETDVVETLQNYTGNKRACYLRLAGSLDELQKSTDERSKSRALARETESKLRIENEKKSVQNPDKPEKPELKDGDIVEPVTGGVQVEVNNSNPYSSHPAEADPMPGYYDLYTASVERRY